MLYEILISSFGGFIFLIPILYFLVTKEEHSFNHSILLFVFGYYIMGVLTMTKITSLGSFAPRFNFIPFVDMIKGPVDTVLNIILFMPLGFFLPSLYQKYHSKQAVIFTALLFSLTIECLQMFGLGISDINDLLTNVLGAYFGFLFYQKYPIILNHASCSKQKDAFKEVAFILIFSFIIMLTLQPFAIAWWLS